MKKKNLERESFITCEFLFGFLSLCALFVYFENYWILWHNLFPLISLNLCKCWIPLPGSGMNLHVSDLKVRTRVLVFVNVHAKSMKIKKTSLHTKCELEQMLNNLKVI